MDHPVLIRTAGTEDIATIRQLAHQIWPATYGQLMEAEKLQYMLQLIYSTASLQKQMLAQQHNFLLATMNAEPVGFASFAAIPGSNVYKLHKIYIRTDIQGKGIGKTLINDVLARTKQLGARSLVLNVKRDNPAKSFYEKLGFVITREEDIDIGNGYFMNDYVMEKTFGSS